MKGELPHIQAMLVLDLLLDVAYHDGTPRDLAVAAEAYTLAGYHDAVIMASHATHGETQQAVRLGRRGRPRQLLRHDAQGLLYGVRALIAEGVLDGDDAARRTNARWARRLRPVSAVHWPRRSARCIYCGTRTQAQWQLACFRHRDLLSVDPLVNSRLMPPRSQGEAAHPLKGKGAR